MKPRHLMVFVALALCAATEALAVGPDPAVVRIDFSIRREKMRPTRGTATITAVVKNVGDQPYISRAGQQNVQLFQMPLGGTTGAPKATCDFPTLNVGQEVQCSWSRPWDSSSPAEGEFPPNYKAMIVYDPDIRLDSNPKNDDVNSKNNSLQQPGTRINALFH